MTIFFWTPDYEFPSGGVRVIYRHVDILNKHGIGAYVLHRKYGHRCDWFENSTPVVYWDNSLKRRALRKLSRSLHRSMPREIYLREGSARRIGNGDILVVPEIYTRRVTEIAPDIPKVILNQGCYLTFRGYGTRPNKGESPYRDPDLLGVLVNSQDGLDYLNYAFPDLRVKRFRLSIDLDLFRFEKNKKLQICFTPRKNKAIAEQVINILRERKALDGVSLVPFENVSQNKVAEIMRESAFFLSFGQLEGFGLPPAEAMACGCVVVGYDAGGGKEFFKSEFSIPVQQGEVIGYAKALEHALLGYRADADGYGRMGREASDYIRKNYAPANEEADVLSFWKGIME